MTETVVEMKQEDLNEVMNRLHSTLDFAASKNIPAMLVVGMVSHLMYGFQHAMYDHQNAARAQQMINMPGPASLM